MATYSGTDGNDTKVGVAHEVNKFLRFGQGKDTLTGGNLNDTFRLHIDQGINSIDGGKGRDLVDFSGSYETHEGGLAISLAGAVGEVHARFGDTWQLTTLLHNIEDVTGSIYDDKITGSNGDNKLDGGKGNNSIEGQGGNDELIGGHGDDAINGGTGHDTIFGGAGRNTLSGGNRQRHHCADVRQDRHGRQPRHHRRRP